MYDDALYQRVITMGEEQDLQATWIYLEEATTSYVETRSFFLMTLRRMLDDGVIKLAKNGLFLEGDSNYQVNLFDKALPKSDDEAPHAGKSPTTGRWYFDTTWFFCDECPGGAVWINPDDGSYYWT